MGILSDMADPQRNLPDSHERPVTRSRCWLFDVDGTLANNDHRAHHLRKEPKDWDAFYATCHLDAPHSHVTLLARTLSRGGTVIFATGRQESDRVKTMRWLNENGLWAGDDQSKRLYMRTTGDHRPDHVVKLELLAQIRADGFDPVMAFDDRASVVKMWRDAGIPCGQVAEGNF